MRSSRYLREQCYDRGILKMCSFDSPEGLVELPAELLRLRDSIDNFDTAIICLLAERFKITQEVGYLKARLQLPPADPKREARQKERLKSLAKQSHLDPVFAEKLISFIMEEVVKHHEIIAKEHETPQNQLSVEEA